MPDAVTIGAALARATARLRLNSESAALDAQLLLARAIDMPRSFLIAHPDDELDAAAIARFEAALARRLAGEPMAYISGSREFWSLTLMVSPATLVPRPETETLVAEALKRLPRRATQRVLDLGTGSGAVALAIARERPLCTVVATDVSSAALEVARHNARELSIPNVSFVRGDWVTPVRGEYFDLVVSNPPYVASDDAALATLTCEPQVALVAGRDGLDALRRILADCAGVLLPGGALLVEHGATQQAAVAALFGKLGYRDIACSNDLAGLPRVSSALRPD
ncbi:MAG TPA: peptide chain release factor N(5)-glutamine methyltransferase [Woeseiaceae bacterium]|nr:peptide chain release factor N(5)-glutamine methyltransferase [Woeseiaceae bacterium]